MRGRDFVRQLWVLMATVFVDMLGFFIVLPLLPFYGERLGADPARIGGLVAAFAFAQLTTAPLWGRLSDRYGRRPMILGGLLLSAIAYVLFEHASAVWMLFASRLVQGAGGGTTGVVQAYLSDSVPQESRAQALGWLTAATSAGVMAGPALGSLAAAVGTVPPGYLAAAVCVLNLLFAWRWLPEPANGKAPAVHGKGSTREVFRQVFTRPTGSVGSLIWIYAAGMMALMAMSGMLALFLERRFGATESTVGWAYTYVGAVSLVMRSLILGPMVRRLGEVKVLRLGLALMAVGLAAAPFATTLWELAPAIALMPIGTAFLFPATTSLVSGRAVEGRTGTVLGVQQSVGGVARMLGPLWAGLAFQRYGPGSPFWIASALIVGTFFFSAVVRESNYAPAPVEAPVPPEA